MCGAADLLLAWLPQLQRCKKVPPVICRFHAPYWYTPPDAHQRTPSCAPPQATCNACVAFTVMAAAETAYALSLGLNATNASSPGGGINFSEQHLWFCGGGAVAADPAPDCATGWTMDAALQALQAHGVYREGCYPWDVTRGSRICEPGSAFWDPGYRVPVGSSSTSTVSVPSSCGKVPGRWEVLKRDWDGVEQVNATAVKQLVRQAGSAMACFRLYEDMYEHGGGVYRWDGASRQEGWHCAQLLGWDDPQGYWLFKSSWGTGVGDKGFFKVRRTLGTRQLCK